MIFVDSNANNMPDAPLGRGLASLIPDRNPDDAPSEAPQSFGEPALTPETPEPDGALLAAGDVPAPTNVPHLYNKDDAQPRKSEAVFSIDIDKIEPNPFQPRRAFAETALEELAHSIREHGILQPIVVIKRETESANGLNVSYELIAGERRWRAARMAGLLQVPAIIRRGLPDGRIRLELALIENVQREDLNAIDRAHAFKRLMDEFHLVQRDIAVRIGKSREAVANTIRLLTLPSDMQEAMLKGSITEGHARAVLMAGDDPARQREVFQAVVADRLTVREAESKARQVSGKPLTPRKRPAAMQDPEMRAWQNRLQERFGTKVQLQRIGGRGKIVVEFYSDEELHRLLRQLAVDGNDIVSGAPPAGGANYI